MSIIKVIQQIKQIFIKLFAKFREVSSLTSRINGVSSNSVSSYIRKLRNIRVVGSLASVVLIIIMTLMIVPHVKTFNTTEAAPGTASASTTSLTITSDHPAANLDLVVRGSSGTFAESDTASTAMFSIATNNVSGYELSIAGSDSTGQLTNVSTSSTLDSIDSYTDAETFANGSDALYNGKWGYKPSMYNSASNTYFRPAPTTSGSTLNITDSANTKKPTATGDTVNCDNYTCNDYTIALGARADITTKAGTYTNTFILTAVGNPVTYSITYADNTGDLTVSNLPYFDGDTSNHTQTGTNAITDRSITLSNVIPTRTNYTFLKWCLGTSNQSASEVVTNNGTTCNGTTYNAGASFGIDQTTLNNSTLYAMWSPNITIKTSTGISTTTLNGTETSTTSGTTVTGLINGQSYTLTTTTATGYSFSSWPTLATNGGTISSSSTSGSTTTATYTVGSVPVTITPTATINSYLQTVQVRYQNADGTYGSYSDYAACTKNVNYGSTHSCSIAATTEYKAASLASYTVTSANTKQISVDRNTFTITLNKGTGIASVSGAGTYRYGQSATIDVTLSSGYEWVNWTGSSTITSKSYTFTVTASMTWTANGKNSKIYFQNATMSNCGSNMYDNRGSDAYKNIAYTTAKIGDLCYMTRNLDLPGGTTLTSSDSNVTSSYTLPASSTSGFSDNSTAYVYNSGSTSCGYSSPCYSYYSYVAAIAGTNPSNGTASSDICPKGWRLPTQAEYTTLKDTYTTGATLTASPFLGVYAGYYATFNRGGSDGYYWSSNVYTYSSTSAYYLHFDRSSASVGSRDRRSGCSVRCVLK